MTLSPDRLILLDTSVLIHIARNDSTGKAILSRYRLAERPERPLISTITEGELLGFARHHNWGRSRMETLDSILSEVVRVEAGQREIVEAYAEVYCHSRAAGKTCGDNDLWIAATARVTKAVLLTCDRHFDAFHGTLLNRIHIPQTPLTS